ncbi:hypothetical protein [Sphingosinicella ginsenosidimutans]|uniref:hypothetical protein n=1 Tax=Allosphingosinicella ginsenosidimutans TaxID=1176539 RepID=UPI001FB16490|nr:hypothetical protein [Sphingosinicella ginsenosidimutans]
MQDSEASLITGLDIRTLQEKARVGNTRRGKAFWSVDLRHRGASPAPLERTQMRGLYKRNGIYWARFKLRGHEYRESLRTRSLTLAERRLKALKERVEETAYFGGVDPVTWKKAVVSWAKAWTSLGIKGATGNRYLTSIAQLRPWLDPKSVHEIDAGLLKSIVAARRKLVSNATVRRDLTAISSVLGHCCRRRMDRREPGSHDGPEPVQGKAGQNHPAPA